MTNPRRTFGDAFAGVKRVDAMSELPSPLSRVTPAKAGVHIPEACVYGPRLSPG